MNRLHPILPVCLSVDWSKCQNLLAGSVEADSIRTLLFAVGQADFANEQPFCTVSGDLRERECVHCLLHINALVTCYDTTNTYLMKGPNLVAKNYPVWSKGKAIAWLLKTMYNIYHSHSKDSYCMDPIVDLVDYPWNALIYQAVFAYCNRKQRA